MLFIGYLGVTLRVSDDKNVKIEFLIVGQGLAGSLLAWRLIQLGRSVLVVDPCLEQTASRTAAGLINPITGKRLVKTVNVERYLPEATALYDELGVFFDRPFLHAIAQVRLFKSTDEVAQWEKRHTQKDYAPFLGRRFAAKERPEFSNNSRGGFEQKHCGYLDTVSLLDQLREFFVDKGCFVKGRVDLNGLVDDGLPIHWQGYTVDKLVFCDGYQLQNNHWFSWLPLQAVQGEVFTLKTDQPLPKQMVQFGKWLLPLGQGRFKLGATWQWTPLDMKPTNKGERELFDACYKHFPNLQTAQLIEKKVGIRPGTRDRLPFLGSHPHVKRLAVFNGFGSKGSLMIPWYADCFARYLTSGDPLPASVDIKRYLDDCPTR